VRKNDKGKKNAAAFLEENRDVAEGLEKSIRDLYLVEPEPKTKVEVQESPMGD
jgi:hypothetical protein